MAQGDTPVYQLQDPDGTVLAELRHDSNGNLIVEQLGGSNIDFKQADASNLNSLSTEEGRFSGIPWHDVTVYGAAGDGSTDDSQALQDAANAATPHGVLYIPTDSVVRLGSTVDVDLGLTDTQINNENPDEQNRFALVCDGAIQPAGGVGSGIHLHHGAGPYVDVRIEGGGDSANPTSDNGIRVSDMLGGFYEGYAHDYKGTVYKIDTGSTRTHYVSVGRLETNECGRPLLVEPGPTGRDPIDGFGSVADLWSYNDVEGAYFKSANDVTIQQYEDLQGDRTTTGVRFDNCGGLHINKMACGGPASTTLIKFLDCKSVYADEIYALKADVGVEINSVNDSTFFIRANQQAGTAIKYAENGSEPTSSNYVHATTSQSDLSGLFIDSGLSGDYHWFSGVISTASQDESVAAVNIQATSPRAIILQDMSIFNSSASEDVNIASNAPVDFWRVDAGRGSGISGSPRVLDGVGKDSGSSETPNPSDWEIGHKVLWTDNNDGSGNGLYQLESDGSTWRQLA